ncbi:arsenate reductase (thioredoxin) [Mammaliicoccus vitulinus]|uniref:Arsenate reductase n=1 Tax=Mammaliicoccus vitulinus TaxID=71237 RepID=A0ABX7HEJ0_9STAP|nr:arsenate reductase (thioredoxin) [Mammaliicoccus vitulinus]PNZ35111.1 arsenate reductase (thioredoxin) [Mammaliicoccus vitulinus]QRO84993.1 arsenate reductase (thioredoxin) [Mammaliicoccus vitulinus]QTN12243.1 arsenate reductase (thioredoxin) [Mammaliicoccus vitulinus]
MTNKTIYFICTGNSCRSQMAEGWAKHIIGENWNIYSAGIETHGVNPKAIEAMKEVNIDITDQTSDLIDQTILNQSDLVVTLCGHADEHCPTIPKHVHKEHWGFDDPAGKDWSEFQRVRDEIGLKLKSFKEDMTNK